MRPQVVLRPQVTKNWFEFEKGQRPRKHLNLFYFYFHFHELCKTKGTYKITGPSHLGQIAKSTLRIDRSTDRPSEDETTIISGAECLIRSFDPFFFSEKRQSSRSGGAALSCRGSCRVSCRVPCHVAPPGDGSAVQMRREKRERTLRAMRSGERKESDEVRFLFFFQIEL